MENSNFDFYTIDKSYVKFIYDNYDKQIYYNEDNDNYSDKPYIGIITEIGDFKYFIPLTSAKPKHLDMKNNGTYHTLIYETLARKEINEDKDVFKVIEYDLFDRRNDKVKKIYSLINYKKCIPVPEKCYSKIIINSHRNRDLLRKEFSFCVGRKNMIFGKAKYVILNQKRTGVINQAQCDFNKLEKACIEWTKNENTK